MAVGLSKGSRSHLTVLAAGNDQYFLGIIDALTFYGALKKAAHTAKELKHGVRTFTDQILVIPYHAMPCL